MLHSHRRNFERIAIAGLYRGQVRGVCVTGLADQHVQKSQLKKRLDPDHRYDPVVDPLLILGQGPDDQRDRDGASSSLPDPRRQRKGKRLVELQASGKLANYQVERALISVLRLELPKR